MALEDGEVHQVHQAIMVEAPPWNTITTSSASILHLLSMRDRAYEAAVKMGSTSELDLTMPMLTETRL
jgi:hypothetical protein